MVVAVAVSLICPDEVRLVAGLVVLDRECSDQSAPDQPVGHPLPICDGHDRRRRAAPARLGAGHGRGQIGSTRAGGDRRSTAVSREWP